MSDLRSDSERQDPSDPIAKALKDAGARPPLPTLDLEQLGAPALAIWKQQLDRRRSRQRRRFAIAALLALAIGAGFFWTGVRAEPAATVMAYVGERSGEFQVGAKIAQDRLLTTRADEWLTVELKGGHRLRLDAESELGLTSASRIVLLRGAVYLEASQAPLRIHAADTISEHIGTHYEIRLDKGRATVRVREGKVRVSRGEKSVDIGRGELATTEGEDELLVEECPTSGETWAWTRRSAPPFQSDGSDLRSFLDWAEAETGLPVEIAPEFLTKAGQPVVVWGDIGELTVEEALGVFLEGADLSYSIEEGRVRVMPIVTP